MYMICDTVDCDQLLSLILNNTGHILVDVLFQFRLDKRLPVANCEHRLNVDLGKCICHLPPHVTLLTELLRLSNGGGYKRYVPTERVGAPWRLFLFSTSCPRACGRC